MEKVILRKSLKGNWGLFQQRLVSLGTYYRYPRCACPNCTGTAHAVLEKLEGLTWVALYVNADQENVLAWGRQFDSGMRIEDEKGNLVI